MSYTKLNPRNGQTQVNDVTMKHLDDGIYNIDQNKIDKSTIELLTVDSTAPEECEEGDLYYNTTTNLLYTATGTDTWSEDGETPSSKYLYVDLTNSKLYYYDGTNFTSYGGGSSNDVVISPDQPTGNDWKLWIDSDEVGSQASEITNSYSTSTGLGYSANYVNNLHKYSTDETVIGTDENGNNVYRKIITGTTDSTDGVWKTIGNPITNIDKIKRLTGMLTNKISLPAFVVSGYSVALQYETNVGVQVLAYGYLNTTVEITIEYTKTTD